MKKFMRFEKEQFAIPQKEAVEGALINPDHITDITWYDNVIYLCFTDNLHYHKIKDTPEIRKYLKKFGFCIDKPPFLKCSLVKNKI